MPQRQSVQKLHGDEGFAVLVVNFVDRADVRVVQCRRSLGFALKTAEGLCIFGYVVGQELEGNKPSQLYVLGLVDHAHTAAAEFLDDAVVRDGLADHWRESYVGETRKSMKATGLAVAERDSWRKIPISLIELARQ